MKNEKKTSAKIMRLYFTPITASFLMVILWTSFKTNSFHNLWLIIVSLIFLSHFFAYSTPRLKKVASTWKRPVKK